MITFQFQFIDESSNWWKSNSDNLRIDIEIVVPVTALAVIVMDTFDWRPPKRSFWNGKKIVGGRVWLITPVSELFSVHTNWYISYIFCSILVAVMKIEKDTVLENWQRSSNCSKAKVKQTNVWRHYSFIVKRVFVRP